MSGNAAIQDTAEKKFAGRTNIKHSWESDRGIVPSAAGDMAYKHGTMDVSYEERGKPHEFKAVILNVYKAKGGVTPGCAILGPQHMRETYPSLEVKLDSVLVATDFSTPAKEAVLYATAIARRHNSKLFIVHVVTSRSESALMDGWRAGQAEIIEQLLANRLDGIEHVLELLENELIYEAESERWRQHRSDKT